MRFLIGSLLISFLAFAGGAQANMVSTERTETSLIADVRAIHAGQKFWTVLHIKMQPGWHTYWKNPGDSGTSPILTWTLPNGFVAGEIQYLAPDREAVGPLVDYAYSNDAYYLVAITPPPVLSDKTTAILALKANWLVCKDICIPESGDLSLPLPATMDPAVAPSADADLVKSLAEKLPKPLARPVHYEESNGEVHFTLDGGDLPYAKTKTALFFPASDGVIANAAEQLTKIKPDGIAFAIHRGNAKFPPSTMGLISLFLNDSSRIDYEVQLQTGASAAAASGQHMANAGNLSDLPLTMVFAFLGGLILNFMPCVFPILSLKALAIAKKSAQHPEIVRAQGLAYTAGVVLSFLALAGILIAIETSGQAIGWGYQMQSPVFVAGLAILLFAVGLNLSGYFELPVLFGNVGGAAAGKDSPVGSFVTGALAVLVATPCTAPFMAPAIGYALTQGIAIILVVFTSLGLGLASPFLVISFFPRLMNMLPKPGAWMNTFKQFLAFPMYLTVVWLLWVLAREAGADTACAVLLFMVLVTFCMWLWRRDSTWMRCIAMVMAVAGAVMVAGATQMSVEQGNTLHERAEHFSFARLDELRKGGQAVLVDATADWCLTCKVNETVALSSAVILKAFSEKHVTYMIADWTHGDMDITRYLESFGRRGVPIYVYYPADGGTPVVLPQILTESTVLSTIR